MAKSSDSDLLKAALRCIDFQKLDKLCPGATRQRLAELFAQLMGAPDDCAQVEQAEAPAPTGVPSASGAYVVNCDGASRSNPGPASIGIVIRDDSGTLVDEIGECVGTATNNEAEYQAMIRAAGRLIELGAKKAQFRVDSELLARQVSGQYKTKAKTLVPLLVKLRSLLAEIPAWEVRHVPRSENAAPDALANRALDAQ